MPSPHDVTRILQRASDGEREAVDELLRVVYEDLHGRAANLMRRERPGHTLQATALVHEAYLKMVDQTRARWKDQAHFLSVAAKVMRRILIDHARTRRREKRGGDRRQIPLDDVLTELAGKKGGDLLELDEALRRLQAIDEQRSQIVELRYFGGLTMDRIAEVLDVPLRSVERGWSSARALPSTRPSTATTMSRQARTSSRSTSRRAHSAAIFR